METLNSILPALGVGLCVLAFGQLAFWSAQTIGYVSADRKKFKRRSEQFNQQLAARVSEEQDAVSWRGFRHFRVDKMVKETQSCTSVYLVPEDGKPLASFRPGQHLTFRFNIPGNRKPVVRCYSLSDGPDKSYYRISVKQVPPPCDKPELPPGRASRFINHGLQVGDRVDVKAPSGGFFLNEDSEKPVVLLAGGIGVTPMISIIERLKSIESKRLVLLAYGVNHSGEHAFKNYLANISGQHANFHVLNCYSQPQRDDQLGNDYQAAGFVSVELLKQVLPQNGCDYYLCGPPPFMNSIYHGLLEWGVDESDIRFEAFGPASIGSKNGSQKTGSSKTEITEPAVQIKFATSEKIANWEGNCESLLEFAESHDIEIESGCRAGSCGTCSTELIAGKVKYPEGQTVDCEPGHCLVCLARPDGPCELEA